ncbi:MAG: phosphoribosylglycinamide formyltransferase [Eubacteriales bacterium]
MLRVVLCVSGGGTNLQAIIDAKESNQLPNVELVGVISNNSNAYALERAKKHQISSWCIAPKEYASRELFNQALLERLEEVQPDLIVLAGYLVNISQEIVDAFSNKIINIHPSLIPSFCGKGYYGLKVHEGVLERGVKVTGATVHYVDCGIDTGKILLQKAVEVQLDDTAKSLQERVMKEAEWVILPQAIVQIANEFEKRSS